MPDELFLTCPVCASARFEHPPCPDGHGADCPDLACVRCGTALTVAAGARGGAGTRRHAA
jgi:hypothetical protein